MSQINNPYTAVNWSKHEDDFTLMFYNQYETQRLHGTAVSSLEVSGVKTGDR